MRPLPYLTADIVPIAADFTPSPSDFHVNEIAAYEPAGRGEHLFVHIEKRGLTTPEAVRRLAKAVDADPGGAGYAGLKDRHATTRQWVSLHGVPAAAVARIDVDGVDVLDARLHTNKLRTGHLRGNAFRVILRHFDAQRIDDVGKVLSLLVDQGMPHYFGPQRFGRLGDNADRGKAWLLGKAAAPRKRFERKLLVSALQSDLFNQRVAERVRTGTLGHVFPGDLMQKVETGGLFVSTDREADQTRADEWEISPTGPMYGVEMRWPERQALRQEKALLADNDLQIEAFAKVKRAGPGTRRPVRVRPKDIGVSADDSDAELKFTLPPGAYATIVLRELLKGDAGSIKAG